MPLDYIGNSFAARRTHTHSLTSTAFPTVLISDEKHFFHFHRWTVLNFLFVTSLFVFFSLFFSFQNDELRKKLGDFNKVNKVQTSMNDHNSSLEQEIKQLKAK